MELSPLDAVEIKRIVSENNKQDVSLHTVWSTIVKTAALNQVNMNLSYLESVLSKSLHTLTINWKPTKLEIVPPKIELNVSAG